MTVILNTLAGRYEIIRQLGGGGFAVTFLARDNLQPSKPLCVVKQLRPNQSHARVVEFFEKEAAILERLGQHPQIPYLLASKGWVNIRKFLTYWHILAKTKIFT